MEQKIENYFSNGKVYVWKETFAVAKANSVVEDVFAAIKDKDGVTVIVDQQKLAQHKNSIIEASENWKIITFDLLLPINIVGFIAAVAKALAGAGISILVVSAYATDHVLVQAADLPNALRTLKNLGCRIQEE